MLLPYRLSAWKLISLIIFLALTLIFFFPSYIWHTTIKETIQIPSPSQKTSTFALPAANASTSIPEKIWYKLGPRAIAQETRGWIDSCLNQNPTFKSEFLTDPSGDGYVIENFVHRPDIVEAFLALPFPILKADFLRYMLLFNEGGIYLDLDVSCNDVPIRECIPAGYTNNASLVVGWEFDIGWGDNFVREFATWTMMARPASRHLLMVLDDILEGLHQKTVDYNVSIADLTWTMVGDVVDLTGPRRFTSSVLKSLKSSLGRDFEEKSISAIDEPKLVGDVLILPGYSFSHSSNRYTPEDKQSPVLVTHHGAGSWKNDHGGEAADP